MMKLFNWQWFFPLHLYQSNVAAAVVGVTALVGAAAAADSSRSAANKQSDAANQSNDTQRYMYDQTRADNADFMNNGRAASNSLAYRLGLNPSASGRPAQPTYTAPDINSIRSDFITKYPSTPASTRYQNDQGDALAFPISTPATGGPQVEALVQAEYARQKQEYDANVARQATQQSTQQTTANNDPNYGSLTRKFTTADFEADPVNQLAFKYGMEQGTQGINRQASATGGLDSGAVLKALTRFGTDYGNTKASESYNRFTTNQDSTYNKLAGVAGSGQVASSQVGSAGQNMANTISQNQIGVGNARGASAIAQGNALSGGLTSGYNSYQQNRLINGYLGNSNPYGSNGGSGYVGSNDYYANNDYLTS